MSEKSVTVACRLPECINALLEKKARHLIRKKGSIVAMLIIHALGDEVPGDLRDMAKVILENEHE